MCICETGEANPKDYGWVGGSETETILSPASLEPILAAAGRRTLRRT